MIDEIEILDLSPEAFRRSPQVGTPVRMHWESLAVRMARPTIGDAKDAAGAWSPARYSGDVRRKSAIEAIYALVADVDQGGDVDHAADALARYRAIVHNTFSSTPEAPRCRIVLPLVEPIDVETYDAAHAIVRAHLTAAGIVADNGAKDASRASYWPVVRDPSDYRVRIVTGEPLDAHAIIAAQPPEPPRPPPRYATPDRDLGRYVDAALRRAALNVLNASHGDRHYTLSREAYALARLAIADSAIADALLGPFVQAAGKEREREGRRTIRDAIRARRGHA